MNAPKRILVPLLCAALVTACSDSGTGPAKITTAQAQAVAGALFQVAQDASVSAYGKAPGARPSPTSPISGAQASADTVNAHVRLTAPCALGGSVGVDAALDGVVDPVDSTIDLTFGITETPSACAVRDPKTGTQFTFDGKPDVSADFVLQAGGGKPTTLSGTVSGAIQWSSDTGSGTCSVDLRFDGTRDPLDRTGSDALHGTVCGTSVETTVSS